MLLLLAEKVIILCALELMIVNMLTFIVHFRVVVSALLLELMLYIVIVFICINMILSKY